MTLRLTHPASLALLLIALCAAVPAAAQPVISTAAGGGPDNVPISEMPYWGAPDLGVDDAGNLLFVQGEQVFLADTAGLVTLVAGSGYPQPRGDGGPGKLAGLWEPSAVLLDDAGNAYVYDFWHGRIRRIDAATGIIELVTSVFTWDYPPGDTPIGMDPSGNLYFGAGFSYVPAPDPYDPPLQDYQQHQILRRDAATGVITVVAGNGSRGFGGDGGPAVNATMNYNRFRLDAAGNIYVLESARVRRVNAATGIIDTIAGDGVSGYSGDGGPATQAGLAYPRDLAVDAAGNIYIDDFSRIRKVDAATGIINTIAGTGAFVEDGDGGPAISAGLLVYSMGMDGDGNIFLAGRNSIRRIDAASGIIDTYLGPGPDPFFGDGLPATSGLLHNPTAASLDAAGNLYVVERGEDVLPGYTGGVRRVDAATGVISSILPAGILNLSVGVAADAAGNVFVSDCFNHVVRRVDAVTGAVTVVAGTGQAGFSGDNGPAVLAQVSYPTGLALDAAGDLYLIDDHNNRVRKIEAATGIIRTVAGSGTFGFSGDGSAATQASLRLRRISSFLCSPGGITVDAAGNLLIADAGNQRVRSVDVATGIIRSIAGGGSSLGDGGPPLNARLTNPTGVATDALGNIFIADSDNPNFGYESRRIRWILPGGSEIRTLAGNGQMGSGGDGGPAVGAVLADPTGAAVSPAGDLFVTDRRAGRVRRITVPDPSTDSAPVADAGPDQAVTFSTDPRFGVRITLDGSGSFDPDSSATRDDIILYEWFRSPTPFGTLPAATGRVVELGLLEGTYSITLRVVDSFGEVSTDTAEVQVTYEPPPPPPTPPVITVSLSPESLWPPDRRMVAVTASITTTGFVDGPQIKLQSITTLDPGGSDPDDVQEADLGTADVDFLLRAARSGRSTGRIYRIVYTASDSQGNTASATATVTVAHDFRARAGHALPSRRDVCGSSGSTGGDPRAGCRESDPRQQPPLRKER
ncbi:MAG TPA: hypothetical protein VNI57_14280 [Candidatus Saccharimonadales bacterium]|nr:hypothetical protein [Candidatus Saccharimonadales bacterium]